MRWSWTWTRAVADADAVPLRNDDFVQLREGTRRACARRAWLVWYAMVDVDSWRWMVWEVGCGEVVSDDVMSYDVGGR